jgi:hypothetical protein
MPRRKARHRNTFRRKFQPTYHLQSHRTIVKYLRRITKNHDYLHAEVDAFEQRPLDNLYGPIQIMHALSPEVLAAQEAEVMSRLNEMAEKLRPRQGGEETDRTPLPRHDAHAPLNSPTQDDWPMIPEPSPGNSDAEPPRPRALYL